jgi:two-component system CheB/CheR fusion protein
MPGASLMQSHPQHRTPLNQPRTRDPAEYQCHAKDLMATIRSIAIRTAETSTSLEEFSAHFDGRLAALARTQRILVRAGSFDIDLEEMVHEELLAQAVRKDTTAQGPSIRLSLKAAEALGLALHELAINAVKYGALAGADGHLAVTWHTDTRGLVLEWRETGVAAVDPQPTHSGFGREWIERGLPYQLKASTALEFQPGGVVCTIVLPPDQIAADGSP